MIYLKFIKQILCSTFTLFLFLWHTSYAQQLNSEQIKAAYLYNFIKHVQWPDEENKSGFVIAIYQNPQFYRIISKALERRLVKGKLITVISTDNLDNRTNIDVVFTSIIEPQAIAELVGHYVAPQLY